MPPSTIESPRKRKERDVEAPSTRSKQRVRSKLPVSPFEAAKRTGRGRGSLEDKLGGRQLDGELAAAGDSEQDAAEEAQPELQAVLGTEERLQASCSPEEQKALRAFDLVQEFGPCVGLSRLQRWRRADKLGLNPPKMVLDILLSIDQGSPVAQSVLSSLL
uniref:DNA polymerase delta subunit 4 n=1 Tax=Coccolithus braarudii TaxID=221442 RepID=A0A7S0Q0H4_9EUKA|mmetsp:Transcript_23374/g.50455  ORF Transcript_23374/g.50455 Transcript_23374/m.50455 type:complete len:161 (+) Transcript_23374:11-493(+)